MTTTPGPARATSPAVIALAVGVGGALGTAMRIGLDLIAPSHELVTLIGNVLGAFVLGVVVARARPAPDWLRAGLRTGVLGGFTTFSALSLSIATPLDGSELGADLLLACASLVLGIVAATLGLHLGTRARRPIEVDE